MIPLETLVEILGLKAVDRAGWVRVGVPGPESVAAHSWGVGWLALALAPPTLNRERLLTYAVLHDLAEVRVGDITPADGISKAEKHLGELRALSELLAERPDLLALATAYEAQGDEEARFVRQLDRLDMALQALAYHRAGHAGMAEFVASAEAVMTDPGLSTLLRKIREAVGR
ncbi:MAG: HD domain-containing protein [Deltaproteobacteria bacterium]|nr:HD domain-containing protein [Deltaproteobacteria bacterium]